VRERFRVVGGANLVGEVAVVGAKNSALKLMAVALLAVGRSTLTNVPAISFNALFLAPTTRTCPRRLAPPATRNRSRTRQP
jgi:hypothetical protein